MKECQWTSEIDINPSAFAHAFEIYPDGTEYPEEETLYAENEEGFNIYWAPAYMMFDCNYVLYDNANKCYHRENGKIKGFKDKDSVLSYKKKLEEKVKSE